MDQTFPHKNEILRLRDLGWSYKQIQDQLGCSKGTIAYHCGAGQREKNLVRQRDRRNKIRVYLQEYKQSQVCADCKENYPYWMMQFDHLSDKLFNLSSSYSLYTITQIKIEIAKCEVMCANCHANRTHLRATKSGADVPDLTEYYGG